jgi:glc operon protein GlcG
MIVCAVASGAAIQLTAAAPPAVTRPALTLQGAKQVIAAAAVEAKKNHASGVIAVVDDGGHLIALERLDNTFPAGATISIGKARTAALFRKPTKFFEDVIKNGRTAMTALPSELFTPLQGGIPLMVDGQVVGGVGVSGASSAQQDEEFAIAGAQALSKTEPANETVSYSGSETTMATMARPQVTHIQSSEVTAAFAKGMPLVENDRYKVHASRRDKPGQAEVHNDDTDLFYVLEGASTLVTGGTVVGAQTTGDGEIRGSAITGGETRTLKKGDVIVIPAGVPHWFKEIAAGGPFVYYTVKVTTGSATMHQATAATTQR